MITTPCCLPSPSSRKGSGSLLPKGAREENSLREGHTQRQPHPLGGDPSSNGLSVAAATTEGPVALSPSDTSSRLTWCVTRRGGGAVDDGRKTRVPSRQDHSLFLGLCWVLSTSLGVIKNPSRQREAEKLNKGSWRGLGWCFPATLKKKIINANYLEICAIENALHINDNICIYFGTGD